MLGEWPHAVATYREWLRSPAAGGNWAALLSFNEKAGVDAPSDAQAGRRPPGWAAMPWTVPGAR